MATHDERVGQAPPISCSLDGDTLRTRKDELSNDLFARCTTSEELDDGCQFRFPGDHETAERLQAFVLAERECCQFFTFELAFEPEFGPITLRLRGPEGTKEFLESMMEDR